MAANIFLDNGGMKMPVLGLGTWQAKDPAELEGALETALELGYRHIDTAFRYENEEIIGRVLKKWFDSGKLKREDIFITTKIPLTGISADQLEFYAKKSLENLQLEYVDLLLLHFPIRLTIDEATGKLIHHPTDHISTWKKLEEQVDAGRTKTIGVSNFNIAQIERILKICRIKPANLQVEMHVFLQQPKLVDFCHKNGITVVAYCPLGNPSYSKFIEMAFKHKETREMPNVLGDPTIAKIAKKHSKTSAQVALRFLIQKGVAPIPKSVTPKRIKENINIFDFELDADDMKTLTALNVGEAARISNFDMLKCKDHPEWPITGE